MVEQPVSRVVAGTINENHSGYRDAAKHIQGKKAIRLRMHCVGVLYHNRMLSSIEQQFDLPTNRLYTLRDELRRKKRPLIDLISGNVNDQGILFPPRLLAEAMKTGMQAAKIYRPDPLGQKTARIALSQWYAGEGIKVPPEQLVLTPGTSLSYWYAFKLLADQ